MMKMHVLVTALTTGVMSLGAYAGSLEQFDYSAGALAGQNGGSGWDGAWRNNYSRNGGNFGVASPGLDHANLSGEAGNTAFSSGDGTRYQRTLDQSYSSGTVYLSFLLQVSDVDIHSYSALELQSGGDGDSSRVFHLGLLREDDANSSSTINDKQFAVSSRDGIGGGVDETSFLIDSNTDVNLFVVRFDLDADTANIFTNPDDSTNLSGTGDASLTLFSGFSFDRVGIANFIGSNGTSIDEIRVDTVAPTLVPEPGSLALLGLGGLALLRRRR